MIGDRRLLATAEAGVERILQNASAPPPKELWDTPIPHDEANFGIEASTCTCCRVLESPRAFVQAATHPAAAGGMRLSMAPGGDLQRV